MNKSTLATPSPVQVSIIAESRLQLKRAQQLSDDFSIPLASIDDVPAGYFLLIGEHRLELHSSMKPPIHGPVSVDFGRGKSAHRREFGGGRGQHLARAVGLKAGANPSVIDATAGLGSDAFVLATLGCRVRMLEQCAPIFLLLEDGLLRARNNAQCENIARRMLLYRGEATEQIPKLAKLEKPDVIYLDPMYPARTKSAAVKKEMQVLQALAENHSDNEALLDCARANVGKRVVVKRPGNAPALSSQTPDAWVKSSNTRYDIYLPA